MLQENEFIDAVLLPMVEQLCSAGQPLEAHRLLVAGTNSVIGTFHGPPHNGYNSTMGKMMEMAWEEGLPPRSDSPDKVRSVCGYECKRSLQCN
jgi:hypothetical protein